MKCSMKNNTVELFGDGSPIGCRIISDPLHADIDLPLGRSIWGEIEADNVGQIVPGQKLSINL